MALESVRTFVTIVLRVFLGVLSVSFPKHEEISRAPIAATLAVLLVAPILIFGVYLTLSGDGGLVEAAGCRLGLNQKDCPGAVSKGVAVAPLPAEGLDVPPTDTAESDRLAAAPALKILETLTDKSIQRDFKPPILKRVVEGSSLNSLKAASRSGSAMATYLLAIASANRMYGHVGNVDETMALLKESARQGNGLAELELGRHYYLGEGVEKDLKIAADYYERAANRNIGMASDVLADMYLDGKGVEKDESLYLMYSLKALTDGEEEAACSVAGAYEFGFGVSPNDLLARQYYERCARTGSTTGTWSLARFYDKGRGGLDPDRGEAIRLYRDAARKGQSEAQGRLTELGVSW